MVYGVNEDIIMLILLNTDIEFRMIQLHTSVTEWLSETQAWLSHHLSKSVFITVYKITSCSVARGDL